MQSINRMATKQHTISPGKLTHNSLHARMTLTLALARLFARQRAKAALLATEILPDHMKVWRRVKDKKADDEQFLKATHDEIADEIYAAIMDEWAKLPDEAKGELQSAAMSGAAKGAVELKIHDVDVISAINGTASSWATRRAAELVGMRFTEEGALIPNPNARWTISDTTRDELRRIIARAFEKETPIDELIHEIEAAGSFSSARAELIATTEVQFAQAHGNYAAWQESGLVETVTSILSEDHEVDDECDLNEGVVVRMGESFPSGHFAPPYHPRCQCILATAELND